MWNPPQADPTVEPTPGRPAPSWPPAGGGGPGGGRPAAGGRADRLAEEWRRLQRAFAYHPHVSVTPAADDPPTEYRVDFRVQTLVVNAETSQLEYAPAASFDLLLPAGFPVEGPIVRPVTPVFHPNVCYDGVSLDGLWHPQETLVGVVRKVGEVVAYRTYDAGYAVNPAAVDWLTANRAYTPTDGQANLAPTAGGEPLARVCRYGPQSVDSIRQSVLATQNALLGSAAPPDAAAVDAFVRQTRLSLSLFMEPDVPAQLRQQAAELSAAAGELATARPGYEFARDRRRRVAAIRQAVKQLSAAADPLAAEVAKLAALADATAVDDAMAALRLIPDTAKLQPVQFSLPRLAAEAERTALALTADRRSLAALGDPPAVPAESRLAAELAAGSADAERALREAFEALLACEPAVKQALAEAAALDVAARWREYLDMAGKARAMEKQVRQYGAEGLQAYYLENASGRFGPYQFEQTVDLGGGELIVRSLGNKAFEVRDPRADAALGSSTTGTTVISLPSGEGHHADGDAGGDDGGPATVPTRFTVTERCDDLMVLLEFLRRSTIETVQRFAAYTGTSQTWAGQVCRVLARPDVRKALEDELAKAARRWRHTILDLAALGPWKERLATFLLAHRCGEEVPGLAAAVAAAKQAHRASRKRVDQILVKSGRDVNTGTLVVPPNHAKQYREEMATQERTAAEAREKTDRLKSLLGQLTARLRNPKFLGKGGPPALRVVPALPPALGELDLADGTIGNLVAPMSEAVGVSLGGPPPGEAAPEHPAAEATAEDDYAAGAATDAGQPAEQYASEGYATEGYEEQAYASQGDEAQVESAEGYPADGGYGADGHDASHEAEAAARHAEGHDAEGATAQAPESQPNPELAPPAAAANEGEHAGDHGDHPGHSAEAPVSADDGWVIHDDDHDAENGDGYGEDVADDQTDVAFGFDPGPSHPAARPPKGGT